LIPGSGGGGEVNFPPTAGFTFNTSGLTTTFHDTSSDSDGIIASWSWDFGDGTSSLEKDPVHTYKNTGNYNVSLTVTDDDGATNTSSKTVTVVESGAITLDVTAYKVKTNKYADLSWSGAISVSVDVYRNGVLVTTTPNDGAYTDKPNKSLTSATYKICETGTTVCSNDVTVSWP
jgi:serine protease